MMNINPQSGIEYMHRRQEEIEGGKGQTSYREKIIGLAVFVLIVSAVVAFAIFYR
ncbi:MAG: hypothetical protein ACRDHW_08925 [Ktedonobacteraceae bacterium]